jgi:excisionase family DNA binding protein
MWPAILNQKDHVMNDLLSLSRLARRLGITQQWLRAQADAGKIPCLKAGNRYLFNPVAVQEALAAKAARTRQGGDHAK